MRSYNENGILSVHAIAGTEVVLLGLNIVEEAKEGLMGFTIERHDDDHDSPKVLRGDKSFPGVTAHRHINSRNNPIQHFQWGDYTVDPGKTYVYVVTPQYGYPDELHAGEPVEVEVMTETPEDAKHAIFFNRGVAGSQAYGRLFGQYRRYYLKEKYGHKRWREFIKPEHVPRRAAWKWLSRGLEEAMLGFIQQANGPQFGLRAAVYELTYEPILEAFADAVSHGVNVKIVHHAKRKTRTEGHPLDEVGKAAQNAIEGTGLKSPDTENMWWDLKADAPNRELFIERTHPQISHNKFIILGDIDSTVAPGEDPFTPLEVWTGSTNFTAGGIFGQSNVGHIVRDKAVAQNYYAYWQKLKEDPAHKAELREEVEAIQGNMTGKPVHGITTIFSPRKSETMLEWYAERMAEAQSSIHFTAAFGIAQPIGQKLDIDKTGSNGGPYLSYLLLDNKASKAQSERKKKVAREKKNPEILLDYYDYVKQPQNRIAWGDVLHDRQSEDSGWHPLEESLSGLNTYVDFLHTKYMLIDPLTDDPIVISGSANFSKNSTINNDENMLIIRGNTRVADIFLTEFMRLFNHFRNRNESNALSARSADTSFDLTTDDSWTEPYFNRDSESVDEYQLYQQRLLFAKSH